MIIYYILLNYLFFQATTSPIVPDNIGHGIEDGSTLLIKREPIFYENVDQLLEDFRLEKKHVQVPTTSTNNNHNQFPNQPPQQGGMPGNHQPPQKPVITTTTQNQPPQWGGPENQQPPHGHATTTSTTSTKAYPGGPGNQQPPHGPGTTTTTQNQPPQWGGPGNQQPPHGPGTTTTTQNQPPQWGGPGNQQPPHGPGTTTTTQNQPPQWGGPGNQQPPHGTVTTTTQNQPPQWGGPGNQQPPHGPGTTTTTQNQPPQWGGPGNQQPPHGPGTTTTTQNQPPQWGGPGNQQPPHGPGTTTITQNQPPQWGGPGNQQPPHGPGTTTTTQNQPPQWGPGNTNQQPPQGPETTSTQLYPPWGPGDTNQQPPQWGPGDTSAATGSVSSSEDRLQSSQDYSYMTTIETSEDSISYNSSIDIPSVPDSSFNSQYQPPQWGPSNTDHHSAPHTSGYPVNEDSIVSQTRQESTEGKLITSSTDNEVQLPPVMTSTTDTQKSPPQWGGPGSTTSTQNQPPQWGPGNTNQLPTQTTKVSYITNSSQHQSSQHSISSDWSKGSNPQSQESDSSNHEYVKSSFEVSGHVSSITSSSPEAIISTSFYQTEHTKPQTGSIVSSIITETSHTVSTTNEGEIGPVFPPHVTTTTTSTTGPSSTYPSNDSRDPQFASSISSGYYSTDSSSSISYDTTLDSTSTAISSSIKENSFSGSSSGSEILTESGEYANAKSSLSTTPSNGNDYTSTLVPSAIEPESSLEDSTEADESVGHSTTLISVHTSISNTGSADHTDDISHIPSFPEDRYSSSSYGYSDTTILSVLTSSTKDSTTSFPHISSSKSAVPTETFPTTYIPDSQAVDSAVSYTYHESTIVTTTIVVTAQDGTVSSRTAVIHGDRWTTSTSFLEDQETIIESDLPVSPTDSISLTGHGSDYLSSFESETSRAEPVSEISSSQSISESIDRSYSSSQEVVTSHLSSKHEVISSKSSFGSHYNSQTVSSLLKSTSQILTSSDGLSSSILQSDSSHSDWAYTTTVTIVSGSVTETLTEVVVDPENSEGEWYTYTSILHDDEDQIESNYMYSDSLYSTVEISAVTSHKSVSSNLELSNSNSEPVESQIISTSITSGAEAESSSNDFDHQTHPDSISSTIRGVESSSHIGSYGSDVISHSGSSRSSYEVVPKSSSNSIGHSSASYKSSISIPRTSSESFSAPLTFSSSTIGTHSSASVKSSLINSNSEFSVADSSLHENETHSTSVDFSTPTGEESIELSTSSHTLVSSEIGLSYASDHVSLSSVVVSTDVQVSSTNSWPGSTSYSPTSSLSTNAPYFSSSKSYSMSSVEDDSYVMVSSASNPKSGTESYTSTLIDTSNAPTFETSITASASKTNIQSLSQTGSEVVKYESSFASFESITLSQSQVSSMHQGSSLPVSSSISASASHSKTAVSYYTDCSSETEDGEKSITSYIAIDSPFASSDSKTKLSSIAESGTLDISNSNSEYETQSTNSAVGHTSSSPSISEISHSEYASHTTTPLATHSDGYESNTYLTFQESSQAESSSTWYNISTLTFTSARTETLTTIHLSEGDWHTTTTHVYFNDIHEIEITFHPDFTFTDDILETAESDQSTETSSDLILSATSTLESNYISETYVENSDSWFTISSVLLESTPETSYTQTQSNYDYVSSSIAESSYILSSEFQLEPTSTEANSILKSEEIHPSDTSVSTSIFSSESTNDSLNYYESSETSTSTEGKSHSYNDVRSSTEENELHLETSSFPSLPENSSQEGYSTKKSTKDFDTTTIEELVSIVPTISDSEWYVSGSSSKSNIHSQSSSSSHIDGSTVSTLSSLISSSSVPVKSEVPSETEVHSDWEYTTTVTITSDGITEKLTEVIVDPENSDGEWYTYTSILRESTTDDEVNSYETGSSSSDEIMETSTVESIVASESLMASESEIQSDWEYSTTVTIAITTESVTITLTNAMEPENSDGEWYSDTFISNETTSEVTEPAIDSETIEKHSSKAETGSTEVHSDWAYTTTVTITSDGVTETLTEVIVDPENSDGDWYTYTSILHLPTSSTSDSVKVYGSSSQYGDVIVVSSYDSNYASESLEESETDVHSDLEYTTTVTITTDGVTETLTEVIINPENSDGDWYTYTSILHESIGETTDTETSYETKHSEEHSTSLIKGESLSTSESHSDWRYTTTVSITTDGVTKTLTEVIIDPENSDGEWYTYTSILIEPTTEVSDLVSQTESIYSNTVISSSTVRSESSSESQTHSDWQYTTTVSVITDGITETLTEVVVDPENSEGEWYTYTSVLGYPTTYSMKSEEKYVSYSDEPVVTSSEVVTDIEPHSDWEYTTTLTITSDGATKTLTEVIVDPENSDGEWYTYTSILYVSGSEIVEEVYTYEVNISSTVVSSFEGDITQQTDDLLSTISELAYESLSTAITSDSNGALYTTTVKVLVTSTITVCDETDVSSKISDALPESATSTQVEEEVARVPPKAPKEDLEDLNSEHLVPSESIYESFSTVITTDAHGMLSTTTVRMLITSTILICEETDEMSIFETQPTRSKDGTISSSIVTGYSKGDGHNNVTETPSIISPINGEENSEDFNSQKLVPSEYIYEYFSTIVTTETDGEATTTTVRMVVTSTIFVCVQTDDVISREDEATIHEETIITVNEEGELYTSIYTPTVTSLHWVEATQDDNLIGEVESYDRPSQTNVEFVGETQIITIQPSSTIDADSRIASNYGLGDTTNAIASGSDYVSGSSNLTTSNVVPAVSDAYFNSSGKVKVNRSLLMLPILIGSLLIIF